MGSDGLETARESSVSVGCDAHWRREQLDDSSQLLVTAVYDVAMYKRRAPSFLGSFDSDTRC
jgi:hypothetical protein